MNRAWTPQLRVCVCAREQGASETAAAAPGKHRQAELRVPRVVCEVRRAHESQLVVKDAEGRVALEIDACRIRGHTCVAKRNAEAQPAILGA